MKWAIEEMTMKEVNDIVIFMENAWHRYDHQGINSRMIQSTTNYGQKSYDELDFVEIDGFYDKLKYDNIHGMFPQYACMKKLLDESVARGV